MSLPAIPSLVLLSMLSLLASCGCRDPAVPDEEGTVRFVITGYREAADLGVERCAEALGPDEILTTIEVRHPDGSKIARVTVRGRDATVRPAEANARRCAIRAVTKVDVPQVGLRYEVTVDGETEATYIRWLREYWEDARSFPRYCRTPYEYDNSARVRLAARGWEPWP
jgi:hypothetical protein